MLGLGNLAVLQQLGEIERDLHGAPSCGLASPAARSVCTVLPADRCNRSERPRQARGAAARQIRTVLHAYSGHPASLTKTLSHFTGGRIKGKLGSGTPSSA